MKTIEEIRKILEKKTKAELIEDGIGLRNILKNEVENVSQLSEKVKKLEEENKALEEIVENLKKERGEYIDLLRDHIEKAGDMPGVLEGGEEEEDIVELEKSYSELVKETVKALKAVVTLVERIEKNR